MRSSSPITPPHRSSVRGDTEDAQPPEAGGWILADEFAHDEMTPATAAWFWDLQAVLELSGALAPDTPRKQPPPPPPPPRGRAAVPSTRALAGAPRSRSPAAPGGGMVPPSTTPSPCRPRSASPTSIAIFPTGWPTRTREGGSSSRSAHWRRSGLPRASWFPSGFVLLPGGEAVDVTRAPACRGHPLEQAGYPPRAASGRWRGRFRGARSSTGQRSGIAMHRIPAAVAESTPFTESSSATQACGPHRAAPQS